MFKFINQKIARMSVLALLAVLINFSASAQKLYFTNADQLSVSLSSEPVDVIKLQDLMKLAPGNNSGTARILFRVTFKNLTNETRYIKSESMKFYASYNGNALPITLVNKGDIEFKPMESVSQNSNTITKSTWISFGVKGGMPSLDVIAGILGKKVSEITPASPVPSGEYGFTITVADKLDGTVFLSDEASITLSNIESNVTILGPGNEFGSDVPEIDDKQPLITWTGGSPTYEVVVVEKTETENSLGDLLSKVPNFREQTKGTSIQYPGAGVKPLQPGKTYVVAVSSLVKDFASTVDNRKWSTPFIFKIREQQTGSQSAGNQIVDTFKSAFGDQYNAAFDQLTGGKPTGNMTLDDKSISVNDLRNIVAKLQNQEYTLKGISVK